MFYSKLTKLPFYNQVVFSTNAQVYPRCTRNLRTAKLRDSIRIRIGRACSLLVIIKLLTALSGTVYRLASSMSDHTLVLFNMFEKRKEKSVVLHISFVSFVINYWLLNARFDLYSVGPSWNMLSIVHNARLYTL